MTELGIAFPRTHDLEVLLDLSLSAKPLWEAYRPTVVDLTAFAVAFRYPGDSATRNMACKAVKDAGRVRDQIRRDMGMHSS